MAPLNSTTSCLLDRKDLVARVGYRRVRAPSCHHAVWPTKKSVGLSKVVSEALALDRKGANVLALMTDPISSATVARLRAFLPPDGRGIRPI